MANDLSLPSFPTFDYDSDKSNAGPRWERWVSRLENLFVGLNIDDEDRKRALLLHFAGERVYEIYDIEKKDTDATYIATKKVLKDYFEPKRNTQMEIYKFRNCKQPEGQSLDEYVTELRKMAKTCDFKPEAVDKEILSQLIQNCRSNRLRRRALRETDKTLDDILTLGRALELADSHATAMECERERPTTVNKVEYRRGEPSTRARRPANSHDRQGSYRPPRKRDDQGPQRCCHSCGYDFPHRGECPAKGKTCNKCKGPNHFSKVCWFRDKGQTRQKVSAVETETDNIDSHNTLSSDDSDEEYSYSVTVSGEVNSVSNNTPRINIKVNDVSCKVLLDTGASVNILDEDTYRKVGTPVLEKKNTPRLLPYGGGQPLKVLGKCELVIETTDKLECHMFIVVKGNSGSLLGYPTASQLGLVKVISQISDPVSMLDQYPELSKGIGKYTKTTVKLHIDDSVPAVAQRHRRTPFHLRDKVEKEINKLLDADIIEKVHGTPTPWVSPIVTPPKKNPDEIRLCVDMREANKAIRRERHQVPTVEELIHDLTGASVFSKIDLRSGYHQLELEPSSRYITTFSTHVGLFRYKRLNFGISSASEIFQETIREVLQDVRGAKNISDDILVYGATPAEHDKALRETFQALKDCGLTINREKCEFNKDRVTFFGVVFTKDGVSPDPQKVSGIKNAGEPKNVSELRSWLGMTNYSARFIREYATTCAPLRKLTRQKEEWIWGQEQQAAFDKLKNDLSCDTVITYFDAKIEVDLIVDASPVGLGAIMSQNGRVVVYASRALSETETRYSQTEREALAVVWGCEHFDMYIRGAPNVNVITDHKPLERIWQKPRPPLRIERWGLRLQPYKLTIKYQPGKDNPADYMSRHPGCTTTKSREEKIADQYVKFIMTEAIPKAMTLDEVKMAATEDKTLVKAVEYVQTGRWFELKNITDHEIDIQELQALRAVKDELVTCDGVLMRDSRIVLPMRLRDRAIKIAHEGHQGISRTKAFIRSKIWFPGINDRVDTAIKGCVPCQSLTHTKSTHMEPLRMSEMPSGPWMDLSADFCGPLPSGDYLFVIIDEYSRYPVVEIIKSVSAHAVIPVLDKVLSCFMTPKTIKTDNGSPFNSYAFKEYAASSGFHHRRITPHWPRANAQAESFNKPMMKTIRAAEIEGKSWKQALFRFLRQYRSTPHTSTGETPFKLMFDREPVTKLPQIQLGKNRRTDEHARQNDEAAKTEMKKRADDRNRAQPHGLGEGDTVLLRNERKENKLTPAYDPKPYTVIKVKGNMVEATSERRGVTRNSSLFKKVDFEERQDEGGHVSEEEEEEVASRKIRNDTLETLPDRENERKEGRPPERRSVREKKQPSYLTDYKC
jgi:hypothetical protein